MAVDLKLVERNQHERELESGLIPLCVLQNASCLFLWEPWDPHSMTIYPDSYQFKWNSIIPLDEGLEDREETALKAAPTRTNPEDVAGPLFRSELPLLIYGTVWLRNRDGFKGSLHESTLSHFLWSSKWIYTKLNYHKSMVIMSITMWCLYLCLPKGKGSVSSASSSHDFIFTFRGEVRSFTWFAYNQNVLKTEQLCHCHHLHFLNAINESNFRQQMVLLFQRPCLPADFQIFMRQQETSNKRVKT